MSMFRRRPSKPENGDTCEDVDEEFRNLQSGWLTKKRFRSKKVWCSLSGCYLSFWKDQSEQQNSTSCHSSSFMDMSTVQSVMIAMSANSPHGFDIVTAKEKTTMMAENKSECMQWIKTLQLSMQYRKRAATLRQSKTLSSTSTLTSISSEITTPSKADLEAQTPLEDPFDTPGGTPDRDRKQDSSSPAQTPNSDSAAQGSAQSEQAPTQSPNPEPDTQGPTPVVDEDGEALYENYDPPAPEKPVRSDLPPPPPPPTPAARSASPPTSPTSPTNGIPTVKIIPASILEPEEDEEQDGDGEEATSRCTEETTPKGENGKENPTNDKPISAGDTEDKTSSDNDESASKDNQVKTNANQEDEKSADDQTAVQKRVDAASASEVQNTAAAPAGRHTFTGQPVPAKRGSHGPSPASRVKPQPRISASIRKKTVSVMPMMPALSEAAENLTEEQEDEELYENTVTVRKPTLPLEEDSHPTVTVEDESGPVKVRVRTPSLTTPSDEAGGMGGALPSAKDLYGEVASKISKPVDVRSKYASTYNEEDEAKTDVVVKKEQESVAIRQLREYLSMSPSSALDKSDTNGITHGKIIERGAAMQALHDLLQR